MSKSIHILEKEFRLPWGGGENSGEEGLPHGQRGAGRFKQLKKDNP